MNNKARNIITFLYVVTLIVLLVGTTFSYFTEVAVANMSPSVETTSATTNQIIFETIGTIEIYPDASNFKLGKDSLFSTVSANVYFTHSKTDISTSEKYDITLNVTKNTLEYSTDEKLPELILTVTNSDGEITEIDGLSYKTVVDNKGKTFSGFDITELDKPITLVNANEIFSDADDESTKIHNWEITVTYVNLDANQNKNYGKEFDGKIQVKRTDEK